jgi:hypothetical protein
MPGPNLRSSYPIVARAPLRMSHGARAWGSYTSTSFVSALKSKCMSACMGVVYFRVLSFCSEKQMRILPIARARILGGSQCPGAAASRSQIGKFGFCRKKLRLDYRKGSSDVGRSGRSNVAKRRLSPLRTSLWMRRAVFYSSLVLMKPGFRFHFIKSSVPGPLPEPVPEIRSGGSGPLHLVTAQHWSRAGLWRKTRERFD